MANKEIEKDFSKTVTITKGELLEACAKASAKMTTENTKLADDPMVGMLVMMLGVEFSAAVAKEIFNETEKETEEE